MADHDLGLVVRNPQPVIGGTDHAADVAAIEEVHLLIAMVAVHDVAGGDHVGVREIDASVAVGVGIVVVGEHRLAAADHDFLVAAEIGLLRDRVAGNRLRKMMSWRRVGDGSLSRSLLGKCGSKGKPKAASRSAFRARACHGGRHRRAAE